MTMAMGGSGAESWRPIGAFFVNEQTGELSHTLPTSYISQATAVLSSVLGNAGTAVCDDCQEPSSNFFGGLLKARRKKPEVFEQGTLLPDAASGPLQAEARLAELKEPTPASVTIHRVSSGLFEEDLSYPLAYILQSKKNGGDGKSFVLRLATRNEERMWAVGGVRRTLNERYAYMADEMDRRILCGEPLDLSVRVIDASDQYPQAELEFGPTWENWQPKVAL